MTVNIRLYEYIGNICGILYIKINIAVYSAVGHIVYNIAEGRYVQALAGVNLNYENILLAVLKRL